MITRPFEVRCTESPTTGIIEVVVRFATGVVPSEQGLLLTQRLMAHFAQVAANGGLAGSRIRPVDSALHLASEHIAADACVWKFSGAHVAPGARIVLENVVNVLHQRVARILRLDLVVPIGSGMGTLPNMTPGLFPSLPFQCRMEAAAAELFIDIDFLNPVEDKSIRNKFISFWESWLYVAAVGAFEAEYVPTPRLLIFPAGEPESYQDTISLFMEDASISDKAFDILVNGFQKLHFTAAPLSLLHIY